MGGTVHPDPEIRAQMAKDRIALLGPERAVTPWRKDWHFWKYAIGAVGGILVWLFLSAIRGGMAIERGRNKARQDSTLNAMTHAELRTGIAANAITIRGIAGKIDSINDRQRIVLAILCDDVGSIEIRRMCRLSGYPPRAP